MQRILSRISTMLIRFQAGLYDIFLIGGLYDIYNRSDANKSKQTEENYAI